MLSIDVGRLIIIEPTYNIYTIMKKIIICAVFALLAGQVYSQNKEFLSLQLGAGYYNYPNLKSNGSYFNYGLSPLVFLHIDKLKIGSGVIFATKKYSCDYEITTINKISNKLYDINYLNIPILIGYNVYSKSSNRFDIFTGVSFDHFSKFKTTTTYKNNDGDISVTDDILATDKPALHLGISLLFSILYHRQLFDQLDVFVSPFAEFKVRNEGDDNPHYNWRFPNSVFALGIKIGIELNFKKQ